LKENEILSPLPIFILRNRTILNVNERFITVVHTQTQIHAQYYIQMSSPSKREAEGDAAAAVNPGGESKPAPENIKKKKKKKKIAGLNNTIVHKNGMTEYIYGFPVHGMTIGRSRYPKLSKDIVIVFVGGGGGMASGIQNSIMVNGCVSKEDGSIELKELLTHDCGEELITNVCLSKDGQLLACGVRGACRLYKFVRGDKVQITQIGEWASDFHVSFPCVNALHFNSNVDKLVVGGDDRVARVYVLERPDGTNIKKFSVAPAIELKDHAQSVVDVKFSPFGGLLATSSRDGTLKIWKQEKGDKFSNYAVVATLKAEVPKEMCQSEKALRRMGRPFFNCIEWSPSGLDLYAVQARKRGPSRLKRWRVNRKQASFALVNDIVLQPEPSCSLGVSEKGDLVAVGGSATGAVQLFRQEDDNLYLVGTTKKHAHSLAVTGVGFGAAGSRREAVPISCSADSTALVLPLDKEVFENRGNVFTILMVVLLVAALAGGVFLQTNEKYKEMVLEMLAGVASSITAKSDGRSALESAINNA
jgi:hypothetical protein